MRGALQPAGVQLRLGVSNATCYRAVIRTKPTRLVIDIQAN